MNYDPLSELAVAAAQADAARIARRSYYVPPKRRKIDYTQIIGAAIIAPLIFILAAAGLERNPNWLLGPVVVLLWRIAAAVERRG